MVRPGHLVWVALAIAAAAIGLASASCGAGNGQAGSSLAGALSSAGSGLSTGGPELPASGLPTTTTQRPATSTSPGLTVTTIAVVVGLIRRRKPRGPAPAAVPKSLAERQALLLAEVQRRLPSGWTVVSQTADTAMLERSGQVIQIAVDEFGTLHEIPTRPSEGR
jgi:hypothetical protein